MTPTRFVVQSRSGQGAEYLRGLHHLHVAAMVIRWRKRGRSGEPVQTSEPAERVYGARGRAVVFGFRVRPPLERVARRYWSRRSRLCARAEELRSLNPADLVVASGHATQLARAMPILEYAVRRAHQRVPLFRMPIADAADVTAVVLQSASQSGHFSGGGRRGGCRVTYRSCARTFATRLRPRARRLGPPHLGDAPRRRAPRRSARRAAPAWSEPRRRRARESRARGASLAMTTTRSDAVAASLRISAQSCGRVDEWQRQVYHDGAGYTR